MSYLGGIIEDQLAPLLNVINEDLQDNTFIPDKSHINFSSIKRDDESFLQKGIDFGDISKINDASSLKIGNVNIKGETGNDKHILPGNILE